MASDLNGEWKLDRQDNIEEYMLAQNISFVKRKAALAIKPHLTVKSNGNNLTISENFFRTALSNEFTVGVECELQVRPNGQKGKASSRIEGNKLIVEGVYLDEDKNPFKIVRYIENGQLVEESTFKGVVCTRWFKKLDG